MSNKTRGRAYTREERKRKERRKTILIGGIFTVFALVGFVTLGKYAIQATGDVVTGKNQIDSYGEFIKPIVLMDPVPFEEPSKLDEKVRIQTGIWSLVMKGDTAKYEKDETGLMLMPAVDIEAETTRLFGPNQTFVHESFGDVSSTFYYDDTLKSYKIPITGRTGYVPQVVKIQNMNGLTRLTVDYISTDTWVGDEKGNKVSQADKSMYYYLGKNNKQQYVTKVEVVNNEKLETEGTEK